MSLKIIKTIKDLREFIQKQRDEGQKIGLVPTMGALHTGHMALVEKAAQHVSCVIVTIFVNPKQFGEGEDLDSYPRQLNKDCDLAKKHGASAVFAPDVLEIYPQGFATNISVAGVSKGLCGAKRKGHFDGVATIVTKLFLQSLPDIACFGQKDYQQLQVIKRLVKDLDIPVEIIGVPIIRDQHGLALSSRNSYLTKEELQIARQLNKILNSIANAIEKGNTDILSAIDIGSQALYDAGFDKIDYLAVRDANSLEPIDVLEGQEARILAAVFCGTTRLIDNIALNLH